MKTKIDLPKTLQHLIEDDNIKRRPINCEIDLNTTKEKWGVIEFSEVGNLEFDYVWSGSVNFVSFNHPDNNCSLNVYVTNVHFIYNCDDDFEDCMIEDQESMRIIENYLQGIFDVDSVEIL